MSEERFEQVKRLMDSIADRHSKFLADMIQLKESQVRLEKALARTSKVVRALAETVSGLKNNPKNQKSEILHQGLRERIARMEARAETNRQEIRKAVDKLVAGNERVRQLTQEIGRIIEQAERRSKDYGNQQ